MAVSTNVVPSPNKPLNTVPGTVKAKSSTVPVPDPNYKPIAKSQLTVPKKVASTVPEPYNVTQPTSSINANDYSTWKTKTDENYKNMQNLVNGTFEYNPETDPRYQAYQTLAKQRAGVASQSAMESLNDRGILNSSVTGSQLGQIQQGAEQEALAAIPQFYDQARSDYQNKIQNASQLLNFSTGRVDSGRDYGLNVADRTGYLAPDGSNELRTQLLALKSQAEAAGSTPEQRRALSKQADVIRSQLQSMGVDISGLGANVNHANASTVQFGTQTLAKQNQDFNQQANTRDYNQNVKVDDRNYDRGVVESDRGFNEGVRQYDDQTAMQKEQQEWSNMFESDKFKEQVKQNGIGNAISWAQNAISQQNANTSAYSAAASASNAAASNQLGRDKFNYEQEQNKASNGNISPLIDEFSKMYVAKDIDSGMPSVTNPTALRKAIIARGLTDDQTDQMLIYFGLPTG